MITRDGKPIADLTPLAHPGSRRALTLDEIQEIFKALPPIDREQWEAERAEADDLFGDDRIEY